MTCEKHGDKISLLRLTGAQQGRTGQKSSGKSWTLTNKQQCNPEKFLNKGPDGPAGRKLPERQKVSENFQRKFERTEPKTVKMRNGILWKQEEGKHPEMSARTDREENGEKESLEKALLFLKWKIFPKNFSNSRVRSWLRMNAGGVLNTCKSNGLRWNLVILS